MEKVFIEYLRYEDREYAVDVLKRYARYVNDNVDRRCFYCKYAESICNKSDNCFDSILEGLADKVFTKEEV